MSKKVRVKDVARKDIPVLDPLTAEELVPLPPPYDNPEDFPAFKEVTEKTKDRLVCNLDGVIASGLPHPENEEEEKKYVDRFVEGLRKLLSKENNWTFLQPLLLSLDYCVGCQTCAEACHVFQATVGR